MTSEVYLAAHSLGAARIWEYAYSRIMRGLRVDGIYALAPPRPGNKIIQRVLYANRAKFQAVRSLKNRRDSVTTVPINIELLDEEFVQPWVFDETNEQPTDSHVSLLGRFFADHHIALYQAGARKLPDNPGAAVGLAEAADLVAHLYETSSVYDWDWINPVNGAYWAMKAMPTGAKLMIARGSVTMLDWLDDFDASEIVVLGAKMSRGFWAGVGPVEPALDAVLA